MENKPILKLNLTIIILIFLVLCVVTTLFLSIPLGIIFTIISVFYLIYIKTLTNKFKNFKKDEGLS